MSKFNLNRIKYDLIDAWIYREFTVVAFIALVIDATIIISTKDDAILIYSGMLFPLFGVLTLGFYLLYVIRKDYFKQMENVDYLIPFSKKDYNKDLDVLAKIEKKVLETRIPYGKKYMAVIASIITIVTCIYVFTLGRMPHLLIPTIMILFMIYYIVKSRRYFYKEQLDERAGGIRKIKTGYIIKIIELVAIYIVLSIYLHITDYYIDVTDPICYEQTMNYLKRIDSEKYRFFPDELPKAAGDYYSYGTAFYAKEDSICYVFYNVGKDNVGEVCEYFESLNESVIIHTSEVSEEFKQIYKKFDENTREYLGWPAMIYSDYNQGVIYEFDRWIMVDGEYQSMYIWVGFQEGEIIIGFNL